VFTAQYEIIFKNNFGYLLSFKIKGNYDKVM